MCDALANIACANVSTLRPGRGTTHPPVETHRRVDQLFQAKTLRQGRDQQQPGVSDQVRVIEGRVDPIERVRYSRHWKCLLVLSNNEV